MTFDEAYSMVEAKFYEADLSRIDRDFAAEFCLTDKQEHYVYAAYIKGKKILEKRKPEKADISVRMSLETVEQLLNKQIDPFKAFTTGKVKAKGNIFLALNLYKKFKGN